MPDHPYSYPNGDALGYIAAFEENRKHLARRTVAGYAHDSADCVELFDALDIWPGATTGS